MPANSHLTWKDRDGRRWGVEIEWGVIDGRAEPVKIAVSAPFNPRNPSRAPLTPVNAAAIRAIPFPKLIHEQRKVHAGLAHQLVEDVRRLARPGADIALRHAEEFEGGRVVTPDHLRRVAAAYLKAKLAGEPVTRAVAEEIGLSPSTAGKRIMAARRAGLLDIEGRD